MNGIIRIAAAFAALGIASAAQGAGRATEDWQKLEFGYLERGSGHRLVDVDGDGKLDLSWVFEAPGDPGDDPRYGLRTCTFAPAPHFETCADRALADDVRGFDIGEIDADAGAELVLYTNRGARLASFANGAFGAATAFEVDTLLTGTDAGTPVALRTLFDIDGDGRSELVVPNVAGPLVVRFEGRTPAARQQLDSPAKVRYRLGRSAHELGKMRHRAPTRGVVSEASSPATFVEDFDGDGRRDVVTTVDTRVRVFAQRADGSLPTTPTWEVEPSVLTEAEEERGFTGEAVSFGDLDGDGLADLVVLKWGSDEERTRMDRHIFFARSGQGGPRYEATADQVVRSESFFPDFEMRDLNGDGRRDLVIPYFHIAPAQAFKVVTQNTLRVQLRLFLMRADGRYAQDEGKTFAKVDRRVVLDYHLNVIRLIFGRGTPPDSFSPLLTAQGDFDGDGRADLASDSGDDELHLRWGNDGGHYSKGPDLRVPFESSLAHELVDINGDGRSDIVSYYGRESRAARGEGAARRELQRTPRRAPRPAPDDGEADEPEERSRIHVLLSR